MITIVAYDDKEQLFIEEVLGENARGVNGVITLDYVEKWRLDPWQRGWMLSEKAEKQLKEYRRLMFIEKLKQLDAAMAIPLKGARKRKRAVDREIQKMHGKCWGLIGEGDERAALEDTSDKSMIKRHLKTIWRSLQR